MPLVEFAVKLGGLLTGIGHVEHVLRLLRVEHQRVLVGLLQREQQLGNHRLSEFLASCRTHRQLIVVLLQLGLQDSECLFEILLL